MRAKLKVLLRFSKSSDLPKNNSGKQLFLCQTNLLKLKFNAIILNYNITLLVQLVERWFPKPDVVGSSPTGRVIKLFI